MSINAVSEEDEEGSVYSKCSHGFAAGEATKTFARSASSAAIASSFTAAERHLSKSGIKSDVAGALEGVFGKGSPLNKDSAAADELGAQFGASGTGTAALCTGVQGTVGKPPQCKATCNGKALSFYGWLPCKCACQ